MNNAKLNGHGNGIGKGFPIRLAELERRILALESAVFKIRGRALPDPDFCPADAAKADVLRLVSTQFHVPIPALVGRSRRECFAWPRHLVFWLLRRCTTHTLEAIGQCMDCRDHGTVDNSVCRVEDRMSIEPELAALVRELEGKAAEALRGASGTGLRRDEVATATQAGVSPARFNAAAKRIEHTAEPTPHYRHD